ncbi:hypothetical protein [Plantibacter sp. YIM 135249]|uniref:hypothetical protein n=1 Tax=Plantibacter sp. YIM 135249 TaxID=3423918 RepID=UPI003D34F3EE
MVLVLMLAVVLVLVLVLAVVLPELVLLLLVLVVPVVPVVLLLLLPVVVPVRRDASNATVAASSPTSVVWRVFVGSRSLDHRPFGQSSAPCACASPSSGGGAPPIGDVHNSGEGCSQLRTAAACRGGNAYAAARHAGTLLSCEPTRQGRADGRQAGTTMNGPPEQMLGRAVRMRFEATCGSRRRAGSRTQ